MELCLNPDLIKKWKKIAKRAKEAAKRGESFDPSKMLELNFLRHLIEEFLEVSDKGLVFPPFSLACSSRKFLMLTLP